MLNAVLRDTNQRIHRSRDDIRAARPGGLRLLKTAVLACPRSSRLSTDFVLRRLLEVGRCFMIDGLHTIGQSSKRFARVVSGLSVIGPQPRIAPFRATCGKAGASLRSIPKPERIRGKLSSQLFRPHGFRELGGLASPHLHVIDRPRFLRGGA